jgi:hypothetical protein
MLAMANLRSVIAKVDGRHRPFHADMMAEQKKNVIGRVVPFYSARVGDFVQPVGSILATCRCGHSAVLDVIELLQRHGRHARIGDLTRRMRCGRCGMAGWVRLSLEFEEH